MSEPRNMATLLSGMDQHGAKDGPRIDFQGRPQYCARCSRLAKDYEHYDPNWMPPPPASYIVDSKIYWLANCEPCEEIDFLERWNSKVKEAGYEANAEKREHKLRKLDERKSRFYEDQKQRKERVAKVSGAPRLAACSISSGRGPDEAAFTSEVGAPSSLDKQTVVPAPPKRTAPDYAKLRAEPGKSFADWWENQ